MAGGGNGEMRDVRCSRGRRKCTNTVVLSSFTSTPPGKSHFLRSTRNRPADVDVLLPSPLLLTLWHFSDLTADLLNVFRLCPSVCLSVCARLCTHCEFSESAWPALVELSERTVCAVQPPKVL